MNVVPRDAASGVVHETCIHEFFGITGVLWHLILAHPQNLVCECQRTNFGPGFHSICISVLVADLSTDHLRWSFSLTTSALGLKSALRWLNNEQSVGKFGRSYRSECAVDIPRAQV